MLIRSPRALVRIIIQSLDFGCAPKPPGYALLDHDSNQDKFETENQGAFEYGPVCPSTSLR